MPSPTSAWRVLLWKDFQQVKSALLLLSFGLLAFQWLTLLAWKLFPETQVDNPITVQLVYCCVAPVVAIMACVGLLIGQERQTGGWAWSSSLPQSWRQALASKACVAFGASLLTLIPVAIAPAVLWYLGERPSSADSWELLWSPAIVILLMFELAIFLSIAVLIFRDSLTGLIIGGVWTAGAQVVGSIAVYCIQAWLHRIDPQPHLLVVTFLVFSNGLLLSLGIAGLLWIFRWRWSYGQSSEITWRRRRAISAGHALSQPGHPISLWVAPRSEFWMLVTLGLRSSLFLRLIIVVSVIVGLLLAFFDGRYTNTFMREPMALFFVVVGVALLGVTTFSDDHGLQRYRFLADRGVSSYRFVTARLLPAATLWGLALAGIAAYYLSTAGTFDGQAQTQFWLRFLSILFLLATTYIIAALCSLCFSRVVFSLAATLLTLVGMVILLTFAGNANVDQTDIYPGWYMLGIQTVFPLSVLLGVVSMYWLAHKWMKDDTPRLPRSFAWLMPSLVLLPFLLPVLFGFLFLPKVPWQGIDESQLPLAVNRRTTALLISEPLPQVSLIDAEARRIEVKLLGAHQSFGYSSSEFANSLAIDLENSIVKWNEASAQRELTTWLDAVNHRLEAITTVRSDMDSASDQAQAIQIFDPRHEPKAELIRTSAYAGLVLSLNGQLELSKRMWATNKRLQEYADDNTVTKAHFAAQTYSVLAFDCMLTLLTTEQLKSIGTASEIRHNMLPETSAEAIRMQHAMRVVASHLHFELLNAPLQNSRFAWPIKLIPTLRWRQERSLALELQSAVAAINADRIHEPLKLNLLEDSLHQCRTLHWARASLDSRISQLLTD